MMPQDGSRAKFRVWPGVRCFWSPLLNWDREPRWHSTLRFSFTYIVPCYRVECELIVLENIGGPSPVKRPYHCLQLLGTFWIFPADGIACLLKARLSHAEWIWAPCLPRNNSWRLQYLQCIAMRCQSCLSATTWRWNMISFVHLAVWTVRERIKRARYQSSSSVSIDVMLWKGVQSSQKWEKPHHHQLFSVQ